MVALGLKHFGRLLADKCMTDEIHITYFKLRISGFVLSINVITERTKHTMISFKVTECQRIPWSLTPLRECSAELRYCLISVASEIKANIAFDSTASIPRLRRTTCESVKQGAARLDALGAGAHRAAPPIEGRSSVFAQCSTWVYNRVYASRSPQWTPSSRCVNQQVDILRYEATHDHIRSFALPGRSRLWIRVSGRERKPFRRDCSRKWLGRIAVVSGCLLGGTLGVRTQQVTLTGDVLLTTGMDYVSLGCCLLAFLLYYNTLEGGFVYDDR